MKMSRVIAVLILVAALVLPAHAACSAHGGGASGGQGSAYRDDDSREDQSRDRERDREQDREQEQEQEQEQEGEQQQEQGQEGEQEQDYQDDQEESQDEASPSPASREMAGYARALGFREEFAATVDLQARVAGVDADRVRAMLQSMAQLTQRGGFPELVQGQAGPSDERPEGGSGDRDGQAWERLCSMLMELLRTRDQEWLRERLQECAAAGMTSLQAVELLARS